MKILQLINSLDYGGAEVLLKDLISQFRELGVIVDVAILQKLDSKLEEELLNNGIKIHYLDQKSIYNPLHVASLIKLIKNYDIIHVHLFPSQLWMAISMMISRCKRTIITTEHSTHNRRRVSWFRPIDRWMYNRMDSIVCISDGTKHSLVEWLPNLSDKVIVINNGIDVTKFSSAKAKESKIDIIGVDAPLILSIGRFQPEKDHQTLLKAVSLVEEAHLLLVGDGVLLEEMKQLADDLNIKHRVHFLGRRNNVPELIKLADVYVQPSIWEGFGIASLEAMAGGTPVIASKVSGLQELVENAGILFEPGHYEELANKLKIVLNDEDYRQQLSNKGTARSLQFDIKSSALEYVKLYNQKFKTKS
ncbi:MULTISPECIES: glycosyltransferase [Brevibacillus]|uniref:glycosyltransferase n=1 Tax=Brevibacillus TaxID=55080 RepID=UPI0038780EB0